MTAAFGMLEAFVYEAWLESNRDMEMGLGIPEGWVPAVQLVAFARDGQAVGFLNLRLRLSAYLLEEGGHIGYSIRPSERGKGYAKKLFIKVCKWLKKRTFIVLW